MHLQVIILQIALNNNSLADEDENYGKNNG